MGQSRISDVVSWSFILKRPNTGRVRFSKGGRRPDQSSEWLAQKLDLQAEPDLRMQEPQMLT